MFWRVAIKPGRPVAMGVIPGAGASAAFVGLPGNPAAVYVTFARVVRPLLLRLAGAEAPPLVPLPVRAAFAYRKKAGRREYVRVKLTRAADGAVEAVKHAQEGAGIITSLTETDGLVELLEDTTAVSRAQPSGFSPTRRSRRRDQIRTAEVVNATSTGSCSAVENDDGANRDHGRRKASGDEGAHGQIPSGSVALQQAIWIDGGRDQALKRRIAALRCARPRRRRRAC